MDEKKTKVGEAINRLARLGLDTASRNLKVLEVRKRKMAQAYEHYRYVKPDKITDFNDDLKKRTTEMKKMDGDFYPVKTWEECDFTPLTMYKEIPPESVLVSLEKAIDRGCFDSFEVMSIVTRQKERVPDPILFGLIEGCPDRFFIDQWDNDVKIEEILKDNEG